MKIGILTFQRADNQGALLQCYALYHYLSRFNIDVEVIDYRNKKVENNYKIFPIRKNLIWVAKRWSINLFNFYHLYKRKKNFNILRKKIKFSKSFNNRDLEIKNLNYNLIIVGSDQMWNTNITGGFNNAYYLNIKGNFVKASYAVSLGSIDNPEFKKKFFKETLSNFDMISLREKDSVQFLENILNKKIDICLDPTLLLSKNDWIESIKEIKVKVPNRYVLLYYIEENVELIKLAEKIAEEKNIELICFTKNKYIKCKIKNFYSAGPLEFVSLILNAETVVTSSFHASVFSCIFCKDIHIIPHSKTSSRLIYLAEIFGINNRIYNSYDEYKKNYIHEELKYNLDKYYSLLSKSEDYIREMICFSGGTLNE